MLEFLGIQLEASGHLCGGFLYLRCTSATIETWQKVHFWFFSYRSEESVLFLVLIVFFFFFFKVTSRFEETVEKMMQEAPLVSPRNKTNWLKVCHFCL